MNCNHFPTMHVESKMYLLGSTLELIFACSENFEMVEKSIFSHFDPHHFKYLCPLQGKL